ncbi:MAG: ABC transporter substrate-binding protein [Candidatus Eremiobacteraeota bacterium]|nr:ABC transporter substrate-binding protein [Candidatus Eremiobacteraeota bacterium]MBV8355432.1 ABC transporter substrate-binding protein [Candidatus Eremiobacteraeota bacterium]
MNHRLLSRRDALVAGAGTVAGAALGVSPAGAAVPEELTLVGVFSQTGAYAAFGRDTDRGIKLALGEAKNQALGRQIRYVIRDDQTNPGVGVQQVSDAYDHDNARYFLGVASSAVALAIEQVCGQRKALFLTSVGADEVTGTDCNMYTFRWSVPTYGAVRSTMYPFLKRNPNAKRWYTITPSYVFGESLLRNVRDVAKERGLTLVGNDYHPLGASEYSTFITKAIAAKPDVLALLNFGGDAVKAIKTAQQFGAKKNMKILYVWSGGLLDYQAIGAEALSDVYVGCQYWHDADPDTLRASAPYQKAYGEPLGYVGASAYIETKLILDGINKAKSTDTTAVAKALQGYSYVGPTGRETIRAFDHQVVKPYFLLLGKAPGAMKDQWDFVDTLAASSYPVPADKNQCKL